ncbi:MAG: HAD family hydrolase [Candidatus Woesearchaeota archaeon]
MSNIIFDWDGTIARPDVAKEASIRRFKTLGQSIDKEWLKKALKNNDHYAVNKELISKYTGINDDKELTTIMTDIFKFHYIAVVNEWKDKSIYDKMRDVVKKLASRHKLVIASTLRDDILQYSVINLGMDKYFYKIYGNTPDLKYSKEDIVRMAKKHFGKAGAQYMIGDKEEDILAGKSVNAKTVYVTWGITGSDHMNISDYSVIKPEDLLKIIR